MSFEVFLLLQQYSQNLYAFMSKAHNVALLEGIKRSLFKHATIYLQGTAWVWVGCLGAFQKHGFRAKKFEDYNGGMILASFRKCYSNVFFRVIRFGSVMFKRNTSRSAVWIGFIV